jgi:hypothetical protein
MGERGNIVVRQYGGKHVFLYTHWNGYKLESILHAALAKKKRWDDEPYLTRIIFDQMTEGSHDEATGFGISTDYCDNSYPVLLVIPQEKKVVRLGGTPDPGAYEQESVLDTWTFEEFIVRAPQESV